MQEQELSVAAYQYAVHNHEDLQLKYVWVLYLHSNTTNYFKSLDQHTIHSVKCAYQKYMVCYYLRLIVRNVAITEIMEKKHNVARNGGSLQLHLKYSQSQSYVTTNSQLASLSWNKAPL
jgi:hypothetical protein